MSTASATVHRGASATVHRGASATVHRGASATVHRGASATVHRGRLPSSPGRILGLPALLRRLGGRRLPGVRAKLAAPAPILRLRRLLPWAVSIERWVLVSQ